MANIHATKKCPNCGTTYPYHRFLENLWYIQDKNCMKYELYGFNRKLDFIFAWLDHYSKEFNESPHLNINRCLHHLKKILPKEYSDTNI